MFYSLFYALSYSRNIPDINNHLTSVFYSSGYAQKKQTFEMQPNGELDIISNEPAHQYGVATQEGYTSYSTLYEKIILNQDNNTFRDPFNYLNNVLTITDDVTKQQFVLTPHFNPNSTTYQEYMDAYYYYDVELALQVNTSQEAVDMITRLYKKISNTVSPSTLHNLLSIKNSNTDTTSDNMLTFIYPPLFKINDSNIRPVINMTNSVKESTAEIEYFKTYSMSNFTKLEVTDNHKLVNNNKHIKITSNGVYKTSLSNRSFLIEGDNLHYLKDGIIDKTKGDDDNDNLIDLWDTNRHSYNLLQKNTRIEISINHIRKITYYEIASK